MKNIISPVKGTRDYYPEQMAVRTWLYQNVRQVSEKFGYQEWEAPMLETIDLYAAKSGDELVNQQSFVFPDRGGDMITLRPELTPSLARMVAARQNQLIFPLRWWSYGPFWRYERPQRGRTREFFQWNIDLIGVDSPEADAELIAIAAAFFKQVGLEPEQAIILVNDRKLTGSHLSSLGIPLEKHPEFTAWIDRRQKIKAEDWDLALLDAGMTSKQLKKLKDFLADINTWKDSETLVRIFSALESLGVREYVRYDPNIIRGLLYYTSTVFEAFAVSGDVRRAILGGGRYDNLMAQVGGDPLPAVGFAMGDLVITLFLGTLGLVPGDLSCPPGDILVTVFNAELQPLSMRIAAELRQAGLNVVCSIEVGKLPRQFKYADRMGFRGVVVLGPDEAAAGTVTFKNLTNGTQQVLPQAELGAAISKLLCSR